MFDNSTTDELTDAERAIAVRRRELEREKWDNELVGRYFRIIRRPAESQFQADLAKLTHEDYVTLSNSIIFGTTESHVFADVVFLHVQRREDDRLVCAGFQASHLDRKEPYLKIQPVFYTHSDFRNYLGQSSVRVGTAKHFDEVTKEEYETALRTAVASVLNLAGIVLYHLNDDCQK